MPQWQLRPWLPKADGLQLLDNKLITLNVNLNLQILLNKYIGQNKRRHRPLRLFTSSRVMYCFIQSYNLTIRN